MVGRGLTSLALMALILSLDARSLYRRKRWSNYRNDYNLDQLSARKRTGYQDLPDIGFYPDNYRDYSDNQGYVTPADVEELKDILKTEEDLTPNDMATLLDDGEQLAENSKDDTTPEPVSKSELEDIFDSTDEEKDKKKKRHDTKREDDDDDDTKEWILEHFLEDDKGRVDKKKRQANVPDDAGVTTEQAAYLLAENELLQKENEYLAGALNAATMGQLQQTNKFVKQQYDYLKKAVDAEQALHELNGEEEDFLKTNDDDDENDDEEEARKKKMVPVKKQEPDGYAKINPLLRKLVDEYSEDQLNRKAQELKEEYENRRKKQTEEDVDDDDDAKGIDLSPVTPEEEDAEEEPDDDDLAANLQTMVADLTPRQRQLMEEEVGTLLESGLLDSRCPAVKSVADGCERLMQLFSVELDQQARDLCNRHKVCYSCGSSVDPQKTLNREACDRIFLEQSRALCGRDQQCQGSAVSLFSLMKREHNYIDWPSPVTAQLCSQKCVVDYLLNGE